MKKISGGLVFLIVVVFAIASSSWAIPMGMSGSGTYVGGVVDQQVHVGDTVVGDPALSEFEHPSHQDYTSSVNLILSAYNDMNPGETLPGPITETYKNDAIGSDESKSGGFAITPGTQFISMKWDGWQGGWSLWYVDGLDYFSFEGLSHALSHYSEWSAAPVPEPATALLLAAGLLGIAGYKRKLRS